MKRTLVNENEKDTQAVSSWIEKIKFLIETNGMVMVFRIFNGHSREKYMLNSWGAITTSEVKA